MKKPFRIHLDHETPFWVQPDSAYFITICTQPRGDNQLCRELIGPDALKAVQHYHESQKWFCHVAVLMPDHAHSILSFPDIPSFALLVGDWKRWLTKQHGIRWQENFFDHRLRNEENLGQKAEYILHNPVRAGFVKEYLDWPYFWFPDSNQ